MHDSNRRFEFRRDFGSLGSIVLAAVMVLFAAPYQPSGSAWAQSNPVPLINQPLLPDAVSPGGQGFTLTVNGTGFVAGSVVQWNGVALPTTYVSGSQLTATVPESDLATTNTATVTVANPGQVAISNAQYFTVVSTTSGVGFDQPAVAAGNTPVGVASGDFNGDGKEDLAVAAFSDSAVSILLSNGDGTFQPFVEYPVGGSPQWVVVGDFNNDGKSDVAVGGISVGVSVLLGNGDGTFQPAINIGVAQFEYWLSAADFNGDGKLDLAVSVYPDMIAVLLGNGNGTFQNPVFYTSGRSPSFEIAVGDFNDDGKLDLATTVYSDGAVSVLLGNGDGTFQPFVEYAAPSPLALAAADFNGDGILDLALTDIGGVSTMIGNGDGTFKLPTTYKAQSLPNFIALGDFNGDGKLDVATAGPNVPVYLFPGNGDGTLAIPSPFVLAGAVPGGLIAAPMQLAGGLSLATDNSNKSVAVTLLEVESVLTPTALNLGEVRIGSHSKPMTVTLSNTGQSSFTVDDLAIAGAGKASFRQTNNCLGQLIQAGSSCAITVTFSPAKSGVNQATLEVKNTASATGQFVLLAGVGIQ